MYIHTKQVAFDPFIGFHLLHDPILLLPVFEDAVVSVQLKIINFHEQQLQLLQQVHAYTYTHA